MKQLLLIVAITVAATGRAHADPDDSPATPQVPLARRLYDEGVDAAAKGRWSIASDRFRTSYELAPRAQTLFNLAYAKGKTGRLVEAAESYRRFLRETPDDRLVEQRTVAIEQLNLLDRQIAHVVLDIANVELGDVIAIDEIDLPHAVLRQPLPMDPGPHALRVQRGVTVMATRTLALAAGATESIRIELPAKPVDLELHRPPDPPPVTSAAPVPMPADRGSRRGWLRSPWLWSSVAVVVAGGAAGAYLFTRPDGVVVR
jgi:hypothetical protein